MAQHKGKYITTGIGSSDNRNPYQAAVEAAEASIKGFQKVPTFSIVYTNPAYDQRQIARGICKVLGRNWVGASADKQFNSDVQYRENTVVSVLSIHSDYMHFGVGTAANYRANPAHAAKKATEEAIRNIRSDHYLDSYVQFTRVKKQEYNKIVKTPPYFILTFVSGAQFRKGQAVPGNEVEFLRGIMEYLGPHIPVFGGSAASDFETYLYKNSGTNYQFANGEVLTDAGIVVFVICNLFFTLDVKHGYLTTNRFVAITKLDKTGYEILGINGKEPVSEYCRLVGVKKADYLKDPFQRSLINPFGVLTVEGDSYIKEALPNPDNKTFHSTLKLQKNYVMNILKYDKKSHFRTMMDSLRESMHAAGTSRRMALALFCNCSTRRLLMKADTSMIKNIRKGFPSCPVFGFYAFAEIGSTKTSSAQVHGETVTSLTIFDKLLTE